MGARAGSAVDDALVWIGADLGEGKGRCGGEAKAAGSGWETGSLSGGEPCGAQATEVARPEPTNERFKNPHKSKWRQSATWEGIDAWQSRYDNLTAEVW
jgi:hypothetical protein